MGAVKQHQLEEAERERRQCSNCLLCEGPECAAAVPVWLEKAASQPGVNIVQEGWAGKCELFEDRDDSMRNLLEMKDYNDDEDDYDLEDNDQDDYDQEDDDQEDDDQDD